MRKSKFLNCVIVACLGIIVAGSTKYVSQKMCYAEADIYDGNYHDIAFDYDNDNDIFEETDSYTVFNKYFASPTSQLWYEPYVQSV